MKSSIVVSMFALLALHEVASAQSTQRVSLSSRGAQGELSSVGGALSADGRFVAFTSNSTALTRDSQADLNGTSDVFVVDRQSGRVELMSIALTGATGNGASLLAGVSGDGRFVAFESYSSDLVPSDSNAREDVFVRDRVAGVTTRVSVGPGGAQADGGSFRAALSLDGRSIAFASWATNLTTSAVNGRLLVYVHDRLLGVTELVSVGVGGVSPNEDCDFPSISANGARVAFITEANNLAPGDPDLSPSWDVFVRDRPSATTLVATLSDQGVWANGPAQRHILSPNGRYVAFDCGANNLVAGDTNAHSDLFVRDLELGTTRIGVLAPDGGFANDWSLYPSFSLDGRLLAFASYATNLVPNDTNNRVDAFVRDLSTGAVQRVNVGANGAQSAFGANVGMISADGNHVVLSTIADDLVPGDTNTFNDVYVRDLVGCAPTVAPFGAASSTSIPGCRPVWTTNGTPRASQPAAFTLRAAPTPGGASFGVVYVGTRGPAAQPLGSLGGSVFAAPPLRRTPTLIGSGTPGQCDGAFELSLQTLAQAAPGAVTPGAVLHIGLWYRDPLNADGFALSGGLWFQVCP